MQNKGLIVCLVALLVTTQSCVMNSPYSRGTNYLKSQNYEQAIEEFNLALASPKTTPAEIEKIHAQLAEAKKHAAGENYQRGQRLSRQNQIRGAVRAFEKANAYLPANEEYARRYAQEEKRLAVIEDQIARAMNEGVARDNWGEAVATLESFRIYESSLPDLGRQIEEIKGRAAVYYVGRSESDLQQRNYAGAYESIDQASQYSQEGSIENKKRARHHLLMSDQEWKKKNYLKAYEEIQKGLEFEPEHVALRNYEDRFLGQWLGILYNEAVQANNDGRYALAEKRLSLIAEINPGFLDTEELLSDTRSTLVSTLYDQAESIVNSKDRSRIGTALANYLLVREEHNRLYPDIEDKIRNAKRMLYKELEFRISMDFDNESAEPGAAGLIRDQILSRMKNTSALKNITILERETIDEILREQGLGQAFFDESTAVEVKKIKGLQAGVKGKVIKVEVKESGRERPSYGSARYVSGKTWVPNPAYQQAQARVAAAQENVLQSQRALNRAQAQQNEIMRNQSASTSQNTTAGQLNSMVIGLGQASTKLSEGNLNKARNELSAARTDLAGTPMQIEEDVYSDYRYEIFDLQLNGEVVISYKIINYTTSEIGQVKTIRKTGTVSDRYIPGDPGKGVASDPLELTTVDEYKNTLLNQAIDELFQEMTAEFSANSQHFYDLGKKAERDSLKEDAVENYIRYIYSAPDLKDSRVQHANKYIYDTIGLMVIRRKN